MEKAATPVSQEKKQLIELKPKLGGFLISYILFSIPGFLSGIIWLLISLIILIGGFVGVVASFSDRSGKSFDFEVIREGDKNKKILIYNLNGPITTGTSNATGAIREANVYTKLVESDFREIKKDPTIKNVIFKLNTPGGEAAASKFLGDLIGDLSSHFGQEESVFYFDRIVASGGLWASYKNKNYIVGSPYGETGSIGVILTLPNLASAAEKIGYSQTVIKSSESKDIGSIFRDPLPQEIKYFQSQIDREFNEFKNVVSKGRNLQPKTVEEAATGYTFFNDEAKNLGLIDSIGFIDLAINRARDNANLGDNFQVVEIKTSFGLLDSIFMSQAFRETFSLPISRVKLIDKATFFESGKLYLVDEYKL